MTNKKVFFKFLLVYLMSSLNLNGQQTINGIINHDNIQRQYIMYVPASYSSANPVPLVFCFHGYGSSANVNFNYTNFKGIADTAGFILVHPQGTSFQGTPTGMLVVGLLEVLLMMLDLLKFF